MRLNKKFVKQYLSIPRYPVRVLNTKNNNSPKNINDPIRLPIITFLDIVNSSLCSVDKLFWKTPSKSCCKYAPIANDEAANPNKINFLLCRHVSDQDFKPAVSISDQWRLSDNIGQRCGGTFAESWIGKIFTRPFHESLDKCFQID